MKMNLGGSFLALILASSAVAQTDTPVIMCGSAEHHAFDFWEGTWRVTTPDGKHLGDNSLVKIQDGCILRENWRSATSPYTGTSYNFYNQKSAQWEQLWLDNQGGSLHMRGNRVDDKMIMTTEKVKNEDGDEQFNQITWTANADGTVRQEWLLITAGQEDKVLFDGLYQAVEK